MLHKATTTEYFPHELLICEHPCQSPLVSMTPNPLLFLRMVGEHMFRCDSLYPRYVHRYVYVVGGVHKWKMFDHTALNPWCGSCCLVFPTCCFVTCTHTHLHVRIHSHTCTCMCTLTWQHIFMHHHTHAD